ncbi:MbtH family protein [Sciscionella sediminilitoris]|uniref:MbtH family protein n=1 Tax=Sciscionella sediminilitoris TaxID=1445613 RepID=UPI0004DED772|nr:MbtH family NRPS accessory protein [Sciscionella sp. SE31]
MTEYTVVVNEEDQYSTWPADGEPPAGWSRTGPRGSKQDCLAYIDRVWDNVLPRSLRD